MDNFKSCLPMWYFLMTRDIDRYGIQNLKFKRHGYGNKELHLQKFR